MTKPEVVKFQTSSRAWKTKDFDENRLPESKSPPGLPGFSYQYGSRQARDAIKKARQKGEKVYIGVNDSMLMKQVDGKWQKTDKVGKGVISVSERVYNKWEDIEGIPKPDLAAYNQDNWYKLTPLISTPLLEIDIKGKLAKLEKENKSTEIKELIQDIKSLTGLYAKADWEKYKNEIDIIQNKIKSPGYKNTQLEKISKLLTKAKDDVPKNKEPVSKSDSSKAINTALSDKENNSREGGAIVSPNVSMDGVILTAANNKDKLRSDPSYTSLYMQINNFMGFTDKVFQKNSDVVASEINKHHNNPSYERIDLKNNEVIRSQAKFDKTEAVLEQDNTGRVSDKTVDHNKLKNNEKNRLAVKQASMFLKNYSAKQGDIIFSGGNGGMDKKVYTALVELKKQYPNLKGVNIVNNEKKSVKFHPDGGVNTICKEVREEVNKELSSEKIKAQFGIGRTSKDTASHTSESSKPSNRCR
jgi:hypothetical protein